VRSPTVGPGQAIRRPLGPEGLKMDGMFLCLSMCLFLSGFSVRSPTVGPGQAIRRPLGPEGLKMDGTCVCMYVCVCVCMYVCVCVCYAGVSVRFLCAVTNSRPWSSNPQAPWPRGSQDGWYVCMSVSVSVSVHEIDCAFAWLLLAISLTFRRAVAAAKGQRHGRVRTLGPS
jgi:hypothetical protein